MGTVVCDSLMDNFISKKTVYSLLRILRGDTRIKFIEEVFEHFEFKESALQYHRKKLHHTRLTEMDAIFHDAPLSDVMTQIDGSNLKPEIFDQIQKWIDRDY